MSVLLSLGIAFSLLGILGVALDEGLSGFRNVFDVKGRVENVEPIKRAAAHLSLIGGLVLTLCGLLVSGFAGLR